MQQYTNDTFVYSDFVFTLDLRRHVYSVQGAAKNYKSTVHTYG